MNTTPEELRETATALLATVKPLMTGREISICQRVKEDPECLNVPWPHEGEDTEDIVAKMEDHKTAETDRGHFRSLAIQFSRETGQWLNKRRQRKQSVEDDSTVDFLGTGVPSETPSVAVCLPAKESPTSAGVYDSLAADGSFPGLEAGKEAGK